MGKMAGRFDLALGTATGVFQNGALVGVRDTFDFDNHPISGAGARSDYPVFSTLIEADILNIRLTSLPYVPTLLRSRSAIPNGDEGVRLLKICLLLITGVTLCLQAGWAWSAFHTPVRFVQELLGTLPGELDVVAYDFSWTYDGAITLWNMTISETTASMLRDRCKGQGTFESLPKVPLHEIVGGTQAPAARVDACILASKSNESGETVQLVLHGRELQLARSVH